MWPLFRLVIYIPTVGDPDYDDFPLGIIDAINYSVITDSQTPAISLPCNFLTPGWRGFVRVCEGFQAFNQAWADFWRQFAKFALGRGEQGYFVLHRWISVNIGQYRGKGDWLRIFGLSLISKQIINRILQMFGQFLPIDIMSQQAQKPFVLSVVQDDSLQVSTGIVNRTGRKRNHIGH